MASQNSEGKCQRCQQHRFADFQHTLFPAMLEWVLVQIFISEKEACVDESDKAHQVP